MHMLTYKIFHLFNKKNGEYITKEEALTGFLKFRPKMSNAECIEYERMFITDQYYQTIDKQLIDHSNLSLKHSLHRVKRGHIQIVLIVV